MDSISNQFEVKTKEVNVITLGKTISKAKATAGKCHNKKTNYMLPDLQSPSTAFLGSEWIYSTTN